MDTLETLHRKIESAGELGSVVRTMKSMAASNIGQYEMAANALNDYYRNIELGILAYFSKTKIHSINSTIKKNKERIIGMLIFGSDQGLVGQFNEAISAFTIQTLKAFPGRKKVWVVGERVRDQLIESPFPPEKLFSVPNSVHAITSLVTDILMTINDSQGEIDLNEFYIFYNSSQKKTGFEPIYQQLLPLNQKWEKDIALKIWPTNKLPEVIGGLESTLFSLVREYLFVSLYRACSESLVSENTSRLNAMQRAEKNIDELLNELNNTYHRLRQSSIDEELFDVVSGFETLRKNN